ncbi:MAG: nucleotidyl transferase AbiEii/AbiGii toxin family protein [Victivallales bacterium]
MLSSNVEPENLKILEEVLKASKAENIPLALIGAFARDVFLVGIHNINPVRKTMDVDWAVKVKNWDDYKRLREYLIKKMKFKEAPEKDHPERLIASSGKLVDILPFGGVVDKKDGSIVWPEDNVRMSMIGFDEAFKSAEEFKVTDGTNSLVIPVVSIPGIVLLKIIAWTDRESNLLARRKHIRDIHTVISHYSRINAGRLKSGPDTDLAEMYPNALLTGARLLGRDLRHLCHKEAEDIIDKLLKRQSEGKGECLFNQDFRKHLGGNYDNAKMMVQALYNGFQEGNKQY